MNIKEIVFSNLGKSLDEVLSILEQYDEFRNYELGLDKGYRTGDPETPYAFEHSGNKLKIVTLGERNIEIREYNNLMKRLP